MTEQEYLNKIIDYTEEYRRLLKIELDGRWDKIVPDLTKSGEYEVIWGLLSRQCSFVNVISYSPYMWNDVFLPVVLRCMVENFLNLSWIMINPVERSAMFIKYGLGRETKLLEYIKQKKEKSQEDNEFIEQTETWINQQRFTFLNEINVGGFKKDKEFADVRKTAQEAEQKDYYDRYYDVFSSAVHSTWNYIAKHNLHICENPLHKNHRIPILIDPDIDIGMFVISTKLLNDTFEKIDQFYGLNPEINSAFTYIKNAFFKKEK